MPARIATPSVAGGEFWSIGVLRIVGIAPRIRAGAGSFSDNDDRILSSCARKFERFRVESRNGNYFFAAVRIFG
jgi:hypothetical protein